MKQLYQRAETNCLTFQQSVLPGVPHYSWKLLGELLYN